MELQNVFFYNQKFISGSLKSLTKNAMYKYTSYKRAYAYT